MATIEILLPKMGESVAEATITKLVVSPGERVEADEPLVEIATDKVDSEVPAPEDGSLVEWLVAEGDVAVGQAIARYDVSGSVEKPATASKQVAAPVAVEAPPVVVEASPNPEVIAAVSAPLDSLPSRMGAAGRFYSPLVRSIAQSEGVTPVEMDAISGEMAVACV